MPTSQRRLVLKALALPLPGEGCEASPSDIRREFLASWLQKFQWSVFFTGTFRQQCPMEDQNQSSELKGLQREVSAFTALNMAKVWHRKLSHVVCHARAVGSSDRWTRKPYAAIFQEQGEVNGRVHLHALVGATDPLPPWCGLMMPLGWEAWFSCCVAHCWPWGIARALKYDPSRGAALYLAQYAAGAPSEWLLLNLPARK